MEHPDGSREVLLQHKTFELRNAVVRDETTASHRGLVVLFTGV